MESACQMTTDQKTINQYNIAQCHSTIESWNTLLPMIARPMPQTQQAQWQPHVPPLLLTQKPVIWLQLNMFACFFFSATLITFWTEKKFTVHSHWLCVCVCGSCHCSLVFLFFTFHFSLFLFLVCLCSVVAMFNNEMDFWTNSTSANQSKKSTNEQLSNASLFRQ